MPPPSFYNGDVYLYVVFYTPLLNPVHFVRHPVIFSDDRRRRLVDGWLVGWLAGWPSLLGP